jgi:hypothetical protein
MTGLLEMPLSKHKGQVAPADEGDPLDHGGDAEDPKYTSHLKVPLAFMERLEAIAQQVNKARRREGKKKRALGWFVVTHLEEWMSLAEAALEHQGEVE